MVSCSVIILITLCGTGLIPAFAAVSDRELFTERKTVMMNVVLIDAMYFGSIFLFVIIGLLGLSMEKVLKR